VIGHLQSNSVRSSVITINQHDHVEPIINESTIFSANTGFRSAVADDSMAVYLLVPPSETVLS
jgi:hypothetical protein